ncbi:hypothetical protein [Actibacterium sp. D379-3]
MTNRLAIVLAIFILAALIFDRFYNGMQGSLFLARKFSDLTEYIAFWR